MSYESVVLADSPTLLWMLNELSGTAAADATGNGNTGTYQSGYTQGQPGPSGVGTYAAEFSGGSSGEIVFINTPINTGTAFTYELWVQTTTVLGGVLAEFTGGAYNAVLYMTNNGKINWVTYDGSTFAPAVGATAYNDGSWHYVAATYDIATGDVLLYVDGSQVASAAQATFTSYSAYWETPGQDLSGYPGTYTNYCLAGTFAASAVYPVALTSGRVTAHYTAATGGGGTSVPLTAPNLALAAPLVSPKAGATVALTAPNLALAAPLLSPKAGATVALTAPNVALAAPLVSPKAGAVTALTAPNVALAAPVPSVSAAATVALTAPNLALAAPLVSPSAGGSPQSVSLTAPNLALAAPVVSPSAGAVITLTAPNLALAAPVVTPVAGVAVALTAPGIALAAPVLAVTAGGRVTLTAPGITLAAPLLGLGSPQQGTAAITLAASTATISNALTGSVTIVNDL